LYLHVRRAACEILQKLAADELVKLKDHIVPFLKDTELYLYVRRTACEFSQKFAADELVKLKDHIVPFLKDTELYLYVRRTAWKSCRSLRQMSSLSPF
jgi:hypothetical protein